MLDADKIGQLFFQFPHLRPHDIVAVLKNPSDITVDGLFDARLLRFTSSEDAYRTFFGLVVRDVQIRLLLGDKSLTQTNIEANIEADVKAAVARVEKLMGMGFGDAKNPLLFSVRSGARVSMPGMMETVLNIGLTSRTMPGLVAKMRASAARVDPRITVLDRGYDDDRTLSSVVESPVHHFATPRGTVPTATDWLAAVDNMTSSDTGRSTFFVVPEIDDGEIARGDYLCAPGSMTSP